MSIIGIFDLLACITLIIALILLIFRNLRLLKPDIRILAGIIVFFTGTYMFFMLLEWQNINHNLESVENIVGSTVPIMWAFFFYSFIQHGQNDILAIHKENLRITLNSIGDAVIVTDIHGRVTRMNPAAGILTGMDPDQAIGQKIDEVMIILDPTDRKRIVNPVKKALETGRMVKIGQTILSGKNSEYYISDTAAPIFDDNKELYGIVLVFSDMTEQYKRDEIIRSSEERYNLAVSGTKAGVWDWFIQPDKMIMNERLAEIIGYNLTELEPGTSAVWRKHTHPEDLIHFEELIESHFKRQVDNVEIELRLKHKKGDWIWIMLRGMVVQRDKVKNPVRMTGTVIDITRQKKMEIALKEQMQENIELNKKYVLQNDELKDSIQRIKKINEELQEAKQIAEESYRLKSAFLANMSHEIRTPMNGIIGFSELMRDPKLSDQRRMHYAGIVIDSSHQLLKIVNDILEISRIETGKISLVEENVVINELLDVLYSFFEPQANSKKIELLVSKPLTNEDSIIVTDRTRLRQILTNLISNAIKFTMKGYVKFGYRRAEKEMVFFVEDSGIGIPEELHEKIFEPFRQADLEITNVYGGTGLGLTISQKLAGMLNGKIWLESGQDAGSVFFLSLPIKKLDQKDMSDQHNERKIGKSVRNMVILIVEDDDVNYFFLETVLSKNKIRTIRAINGIEAVEMCKMNREIDMVLMDIKLPLLNGYEATRKIKKLRPDLPVIAQTAYAMQEDREKASQAGCDGYIAKPIISSDLIQLIENLRIRK